MHVQVEDHSKFDDEYIHVTDYEIPRKNYKFLTIPTSLICGFLGIFFAICAMCSNQWIIGQNTEGWIVSAGLFEGCVQEKSDSNCKEKLGINGKIV